MTHRETQRRKENTLSENWNMNYFHKLKNGNRYCLGGTLLLLGKQKKTDNVTNCPVRIYLMRLTNI